MHYMIGKAERRCPMGKLLEIEATITERGQTTVPSAIRKALGLERNAKVMFRQMDDGTVTIAPKPEDDEADDPVISNFLAFLERDMIERPDALVPPSSEMLKRGRQLTEGVEVDLDAPLKDD
jgi:antitoxin PrlF